MGTNRIYDTIVIGAGHAGTEAALAVARAGFSVLFVTMKRDAICQMSCNPAIGGLAKGHMVRELDALGGEMGRAIDATAIQFRMLNRSKGPAVWAPRAQADKKQYRLYMMNAVANEPNIHLVEEQATKLISENAIAKGITTKSGKTFLAKKIIVTTGTFMRGLIHVGEQNFVGGRRGEAPSIGFSDSLRDHGFEVVRFKTGTPCRIKGSTINFDVCEKQLGDEVPSPFSFRTSEVTKDQMPCWLTFTNEKTHQIIRDNLHLSPLYAGRIEGVGPRYCPSIEDKVVKFSERDRHQIYLEPEGRDTDEFYVNGLSTSLPKEIQAEFIKSIAGLENAEIIRFGYAIEYDCMPPTQLKHTLETKRVSNLYFAGQINCTSGYEEAAAQGLMAGLNAIRSLKDEEAFVLDRSEAYIGVLIDDLVTRGTNEPYRMFTSRAEFRLLLRQDNANRRLLKYGNEFGLISDDVYAGTCNEVELIEKTIKSLENSWHENDTLAKFVRRPGNSVKSLPYNEIEWTDISDSIISSVEFDIKYAGYIERQMLEVRRFRKLERRKIPASIDYTHIKGMRQEALEKFERVGPVSIGQASRIPGVTSCDISQLLVHVQRLQTEPTEPTK